jgi:biopolymer transport protein ExbB/TolQ
MHFLIRHYLDGGWGMWPILFWLTLVIALVAERGRYVLSASRDFAPLFESASRALATGDLSLAVQLCHLEDTPAARMLSAALLRLNSSAESLRASVHEAWLCESTALARRIDYFATLGNLAMLNGLLGTISGLVTGFGCCGGCYHCGGGPSIDPGKKAEWLAEGIAEAMNCSAFGLLVAIISLCAYASFRARVNTLTSELDAEALAVIDLVLSESRRREVANLSDPSGPFRAQGPAGVGL